MENIGNEMEININITQYEKAFVNVLIAIAIFTIRDFIIIF